MPKIKQLTIKIKKEDLRVKPRMGVKPTKVHNPKKTTYKRKPKHQKNAI